MVPAIEAKQQITHGERGYALVERSPTLAGLGDRAILREGGGQAGGDRDLAAAFGPGSAGMAGLWPAGRAQRMRLTLAARPAAQRALHAESARLAVTMRT